MRLWIGLVIPLGLILSLSGNDGRAGGKAARDRVSALQVDGELLAGKIDANLEAFWKREGVTPTPPIDDLAFARRVWLDLLGTIPSLQELREIEAMAEPPNSPERRAAMVDKVMLDRRFDEALAERLARIAVGANPRPDDLIYRHRRLLAWLTAQVSQDRSWDELVREMITAEGISTDTPAVNFIRSQDADPLKLAARTTRAFLGIRIDCAQCHDHPFARWKQADFEGLAAWFARIDENLAGVSDTEGGELEFEIPGAAPRKVAAGETPEEPKEEEQEEVYMPEATPGGMGVMMSVGAGSVPKRVVPPQVPFGLEYLPPEERKNRRERLADWVTHPENPFFAKAIANRLWYLLMGRGLVEPLDELDMTKPRNRELLELLAEEIVASGFDVKRMIRGIVSSKAYAIGSAVQDGVDEEEATDAMAVYPLKPLRGDQLGRAITQAGYFWTWDQERFPILRLAHFTGVNEFTKRHGDDLDAELPAEETLLMRLHLLNGKTVSEVTKDDNGMGPVNRLPKLSPSDEAAVENAFLMTLTRRPSQRERDHFVSLLKAAKNDEGKPDEGARNKIMADLFWSLLNTTEFAWAH